MAIIHALFWLALFAVFWTYFGYFIIIVLVSLWYTKKVKAAEFCPKITLVITAYNEEKHIAQKLENTLALDYPKDKMEIIVVSDASEDRTEDIVRSYQDHGVKLLVIPERRGKHYGQGRGIRMAANDIVVLTDATTYLEPGAVRKMVGNFADPSVGCVSGQDKVIVAGDETPGEGAYVKYEMKLRDIESRVGSLVGVSGCFFAVRKNLCDQWIDNMSSDFYMPIVTYMNGYRTIVEKEAVGEYRVLRNQTKEFERKVRTVVHGLEVLFRFKSILNPFKYGSYSLQMISHKLLRWLVPFFMIVVFVCNISLLSQGYVYEVLFAAQLLFYILVSVALLIEKLQDMVIFRLPAFFVMVNLSILVAWYKYLLGEQYVVWDATKR
jgi:cellulose synthase/poly-beta-1,6-N-acetylglucosamine synthase-like glycosyltransferase